MNGQQQHEMVLEKTHSSGAEEWYCPECGRRMAITWEPWKKVILEPGDLYVSHTGGKGGLKIGSVQIAQGGQIIESSTPGLSTDDPYLAPWQRWLDSVDNDDLWNKEI